MLGGVQPWPHPLPCDRTVQACWVPSGRWQDEQTCKCSLLLGCVSQIFHVATTKLATIEEHAFHYTFRAELLQGNLKLSVICTIQFFPLFCRYELISECWLCDPTKRPSFAMLVENVTSLLKNSAGYLDLNTLHSNERPVLYDHLNQAYDKLDAPADAPN